MLKRINLKTNRSKILLIWGRQDNFVPLSIGQRLSTQYPWLKLLILENTGHCPHDESPCDFNHYVLDWLKNNLGGY